MSEIAERRKPRPRVAEHASDRRRIERRALRDIRSVADNGDDERAAGQRERRCRKHQGPPRHGRRRRREEVRERRSDGQRADQHAERGAPPRVEPAGGDLHPGRIDPRERCARDQAQHDDARGAVRADERRIRGRRDDAAGGEQTSCAQQVGRFSTADTSEPTTNPPARPSSATPWSRRRDGIRRRSPRSQPSPRTTASCRETSRATATRAGAARALRLDPMANACSCCCTQSAASLDNVVGR